MRLYLAAAVLMLAFVAYTEAQDAPQDDSFANFQDKMTEFGRGVADKARDTIETIKNSEFAQKTHNWFTDSFQKLKTKFSELSQD
ncbi:apolipoprotein C-I [Nematolebias whitei]|uniref:apolipoprotein C-I n=1 Tax=Nematolebias whitei TaxID=451745 RepID=UPI0018976BCC|nr:apolipoprotein C-I [Nematolebias whitei]XP_037532098.1 apolipoprotein C-I [Nematolebias whitei]